MKIPKTIKLGGHIIRVDCSKELPDCDGDSSSSKHLIRICKTLPHSRKENVLLHEIFHFLNPTLGNSVLGHALLDSLAQQFYQVLADNKLLR